MYKDLQTAEIRQCPTDKIYCITYCYYKIFKKHTTPSRLPDVNFRRVFTDRQRCKAKTVPGAMYFSLANKATYSTGNALRWTKVSFTYYLWYPLPKLTLRLAVLIYSYNSIQLIHFPTYLPVVKPYKCFL